MRLKNLEIVNFRTIEHLAIEMTSHYMAISGKNNSGKSNVLRPLKALFEPENRFRYYDEEEISRESHFPAWKKKESTEPLKISATLEITRKDDTGIFKLTGEFFKIDSAFDSIEIKLSAEYQKDKDQPEYSASCGETTLDGFKSKTIFSTIKSSGAFQFHNSTAPHNPFVSRTHLTELFGALSKADREQLNKDQDRLSKTVASLAKKHQKDVSDLLGRLEEKYSIGLSAQKLSLDFLPVNITLGDKRVDVSLDDWGSGTQNRTHILLSLFKAKKLKEDSDVEIKVSPILIVEEPESFLHPSAQAEFGRVLQDLSEEFKVQVIVATHSPYFLSQQQLGSNILLNRKIEAGRTRATERVAVDGDNWMEPFALNLGLANPEFEPWKEIFFAKSNKILLVEGDTDKEYFELLRDEQHGSNRLNFQGDIYEYSGVGTLQNGVLLRFIKGRYHRFFVTFDLDCEGQVSKALGSLGFEKGKHYHPVGLPGGGKDKIEGLLPDSVRASVFGNNGDLVQVALSTGDEAKSAKQRLKKLLLQEFKAKAKPGNEYFGEFYKIAKIINKAMQ